MSSSNTPYVPVCLLRILSSKQKTNKLYTLTTCDTSFDILLSTRAMEHQRYVLELYNHLWVHGSVKKYGDKALPDSWGGATS
jgi:hypothetical protein